jgi:hypothetical protein
MLQVLIPQLDFGRPSTWSHPVTWERVINYPLDNKNDNLQICFSYLHMNSFPHYCATIFPIPHLLEVTTRLFFL